MRGRCIEIGINGGRRLCEPVAVSENDRELPAFTWDGSHWSAQIKLPAWKPYLAKPNQGFVTVDVYAPEQNDEKPSPPSEEQRVAISQLVDDQEKISAAALKALFKQYAVAQETPDEDDGRPRRPLKDVTGLRRHVTLNQIYVLAMAKQKRAYLGFSFSCSWDEEHGAGVMTHKTRVVTSGGADHAFLGWLAKRDGGLPLELSAPLKTKSTAAKRGATEAPTKIAKKTLRKK